jgi:hypothetical protein
MRTVTFIYIYIHGSVSIHRGALLYTQSSPEIFVGIRLNLFSLNALYFFIESCFYYDGVHELHPSQYER